MFYVAASLLFIGAFFLSMTLLVTMTIAYWSKIVHALATFSWEGYAPAVDQRPRFTPQRGVPSPLMRQPVMVPAVIRIERQSLAA